jgi:hypothetical protein
VTDNVIFNFVLEFISKKIIIYIYIYISFDIDLQIKFSMLSIYELPSSLDQQPQISPKIKFSIWHTFKHHIPRFLLTILMDVILPLAIFFSLQKYIKPVYALLAASSPPLSMVIFKAIWFCTFDALGFLVFFTFAISAIVAIITRNPIILLLEKSLVTGIFSLIFAITLIPFHCCHYQCRIRPLAYYFYQDLVPTNLAQIGLPENIFSNEQEQIGDQYTQLTEELSQPKLSNKQEVAQVYEWIYTHCSSFRLSCYMITSIWSIGFLLEFTARLSLIIIHLPINKIVIYAHIILSSITILCIVLSIICITIERKHTLLFIERWNIEQQPRRLTEIGTSFVRGKSNSNSVLSIDTAQEF